MSELAPAPALGFRTARVDDVAAVVALVESAYRGASSRRGWTTEADFLEGHRLVPEVLEADIRRPDSVILLGLLEDRIAGCVHIERREGFAYLGMLTVRPELQAAGLGKRLMDAAEQQARQLWRVDRVRMSVISLRAELIAFYRRRGYRLTGESLPFPYGDERFGQPLRSDLEFKVLEKQW